MQGTQYAPRESILCMEHFVALQGITGDYYLQKKNPNFVLLANNFFKAKK